MLNLLCFSRRNPLVSANHELYGPFNFTKMLLAPLGTKALVYNNPAIRASWAPHATDGYYVSPAVNHYRCLRFYILTTCRFCFADTWQLYPSHCQVPVLSEHDQTLLAAKDILQVLGSTFLTSARAKSKHLSAIRKLTDIMLGQPNTPPPDLQATRVDNATPPRVAISTPPRVATTLNTITAPSTIRRLPRVHQRVSRHNNPFEILSENNDDEVHNDDTVIHSNCSPQVPAHKAPNPSPRVPVWRVIVRDPGPRRFPQVSLREPPSPSTRLPVHRVLVRTPSPRVPICNTPIPSTVPTRSPIPTMDRTLVVQPTSRLSRPHPNLPVHPTYLP